MSFISGGRIGKGVRDTLHEEWAQAVSSVGIAPRTKSQILCIATNDTMDFDDVDVPAQEDAGDVRYNGNGGDDSMREHIVRQYFGGED
ncbi:unnamed protein product [Nippostrongylus brasiliensis]|uniref:Rad51 domain-containing protein n=1 Tax=Nippostrongylus brasiliensis TaxID=27835 RepID=A0A0N4XN85_NIPBR|nr:unnamed protein product [Nippostrongylus brasiliensis]